MAKGKGVAVDEHSDIRRSQVRRGSIGLVTAVPGGGMVIPCCWKASGIDGSADRGFDRRCQLGAGGRHRLAVGQGDRGGTGRGRFSSNRRRVLTGVARLGRPVHPTRRQSSGPHGPRSPAGLRRRGLVAPDPFCHHPAGREVAARPASRRKLGSPGSEIGHRRQHRSRGRRRGGRILRHAHARKIIGCQPRIVGQQRIQQRIPPGVRPSAVWLLHRAARPPGRPDVRRDRSVRLLEASYSDVQAAISADFDVSSRLALRTTARMSRSLPIRKRWKSRAPAGVSRSDRVRTAASVSCCNLVSAWLPSTALRWAFKMAVITCMSS